MLASTTDAVAAWSTFAAVVVALGVSLVPVWWRWHKRPHLKWTVGRDEPHRLAIVGQSGITAGWDLRIFVGNKAGRRRADNVRAQLRTFWVCTTVEGLNAWGDLAIDLVPLRWASRRDEDGSAQQVTVIPPGGVDFLTFARWDRRSLLIPHARQDDADFMRGFGSASFRFHVVITADEIEPVSAYILVSTVSGGVSAVEPSTAPDPNQVHARSLFKLLDQDTHPG